MEILIKKSNNKNGSVSFEVLVDGKSVQSTTLGKLLKDNYEWACGLVATTVAGHLQEDKPDEISQQVKQVEQAVADTQNTDSTIPAPHPES